MKIGPLGSIRAAAVAVAVAAPAGIIFIPAGASLSWMVVFVYFQLFVYF